MVGLDAELRMSILHEVHNSSYGGHSGIHGTYMRLKHTFYWPGMKKAIIQLVCHSCQKNKPNFGALPGLLQPLPVHHTAWSHISMDFIEVFLNLQARMLY